MKNVTLTCRRAIGRAIHWMLLFTIVGLIVVGLGCGGGDGNSDKSAQSRVAAGRSAVAHGPARITADYAAGPSAPFVFLIGENHASIQSQTEEATVLGQLLDANAIDALLVEGSNGPLNAKEFAQEFKGSLADPETASDYWMRELQDGTIGAAEYIALTRPSTVLIGVEDMAAKAKMAVAFGVNPEGELEREAASRQRGLDTLGNGVAELRAAGALRRDDETRIQSEIQTYRDAADRVKNAANVRLEMAKPIEELEIQEIQAADTEQKLRAKLSTQIEEYERDYKIVDDARSRIDELERRGELAPIEEAAKRVKELEDTPDFQQLIQFDKRCDQLTKSLDELNSKPEIQAAVKAEGDAITALRDAYVIAANDLLQMGRTANTRLAGVATFYGDEADRAEREQQDGSQQAELLERDTAMALNTANSIAQGKSLVALVVGSAHLPGVEAQLKARGLSVLTLQLPGNDAPSAPWEVRAYDRRSERATRLFTAEKEGSLLPESRLADPVWKDERVKSARLLLSLAQTLERNTSADALRPRAEGFLKDRDLSFLTGRNLAPREADFGPQVLESGVLPSRPDWRYAIYDRDKGRGLVKKLSDSESLYAFYYRRTTGADRSQVVTMAGDVSLREFASSVPRPNAGGKPFKRIVLFGEPDERDEAGGSTSLTWSRLRNGGGGGNYEPPPGNGDVSDLEGDPDSGPGNGGDFWAAAFLPASKERIATYRTINPERAAKNLAALDKQDSRFIGTPTIIDETDLVGGLERLPFTPTRGDFTQTVVIVARNVPEFRAAVAKAARSGKLTNKQVALVTCGDAFDETASLRELLLDNGALLVWVPDRQLSLNSAQKLRARIVSTSESFDPAKRPATIDQLMDQTLRRWHSESPSDPDLAPLKSAASYVEGQKSPFADVNG